MHPILIRIPLPAWGFLGSLHSLPIHGYGVMLGLSLVVGWYMSLTLAERDGLPRETMANCYVVTAATAVVAARVLYFVTNPSELGSVGDFFALWRGGLVAYGGFVGGFFGSVFYLRRYRVPLWPWADATAPGLAAGLMLTRIGCYLFGCDFGKPLSASAPEWLKRLGSFPHWAEGTIANGDGSPAWIQHVQHRGLSHDATMSLPVHPTQIYESLVGAALFGLLLLVRRYQRFRGQLFLTFVFAYGLLRFLLELIRDDLERGQIGPELPEHLLVPAGLVVFGVAFAALIADSIGPPVARRVAQVAAFVPAVAMYLILAPESFGEPTIVQLSTSQWVGLFTAVPAAIAYGVFWQAAKLHPEQAMDVRLAADPLQQALPLDSKGLRSDGANQPPRAEPSGDAAAQENAASQAAAGSEAAVGAAAGSEAAVGSERDAEAKASSG